MDTVRQQQHRDPVTGTVPVRGHTYHLTRWPGADSAPVFLLHGYLDCGATFQFLANAMSPARTLVAPDWRGFGRSSWTPGGYWFPDYYADLDALLEQLAPASRSISSATAWEATSH
jgi:pimeloyl-ACP methyl ester carboxylesterase